MNEHFLVGLLHFQVFIGCPIISLSLSLYLSIIDRYDFKTSYDRTLLVGIHRTNRSGLDDRTIQQATLFGHKTLFAAEHCLGCSGAMGQAKGGHIEDFLPAANWGIERREAGRPNSRSCCL